MKCPKCGSKETFTFSTARVEEGDDGIWRIDPDDTSIEFEDVIFKCEDCSHEWRPELGGEQLTFVNHIVLSGTIVGSPTLRHINSLERETLFVIAQEYANGVVHRFRCYAYGGLADIVHKFGAHGVLVCIEGKIEERVDFPVVLANHFWVLQGSQDATT